MYFIKEVRSRRTGQAFIMTDRNFLMQLLELFNVNLPSTSTRSKRAPMSPDKSTSSHLVIFQQKHISMDRSLGHTKYLNDQKWNLCRILDQKKNPSASSIFCDYTAYT